MRTFYVVITSKGECVLAFNLRREAEKYANELTETMAYHNRMRLECGLPVVTYEVQEVELLNYA